MPKMKEVAAMLGVEIGEEFEINGYNGSRFRILDDKMELKSDTDKGLRWIEVTGDSLYELLTGQRKIIKKPWKPKLGEEYFVCMRGDVCPKKWSACTADLMAYAAGNCLRTWEEAEARRNEILKRLEKIYVEGKPLVEADELMKSECQK